MEEPRVDIAALLPVVLICLLSLMAGFALKEHCPRQDSGTYPRLCYSDVTALYHVRGLDKGVLPYLDFPSGGSPGDPGFLEYPVGTGAVMASTAAAADSVDAYLRINALLLGAVGLVSAFLLAQLTGWAALRFAAAPVLILYAFTNWDLLAVGCVMAGCFARQRGRPGWAGAWFGAGIAVKLFPVLFLVPLVLERLWARDRPGLVRSLAAGTTAAIVPNMVIATLNSDGWWATYSFHSRRGADLNSIWGVVLPDGVSPQALNLLTGILMLAGGAAVLRVGRDRACSEGNYPFLAVSSALVALFLLWSKVASPQYALWLLPSLVLLRLRWRWWAAWNAMAVIVYLVTFGVGLGGYGSDLAQSAVKTAATLRFGILAALVVVLMRAAPVGPEP